MQTPNRVILIDIDGLRYDHFRSAVEDGKAPNLRRIVSDAAYHTAAHSTAPSVTFAAQASIITGAHPAEHKIAGNQLFDRFGRLNQGRARYYGFDVGDTLEYDDAVAVFADDLADKMLSADVQTIYETAAQHGKQSLVVYHMYARGAQQVVRPSIISLARFKQGTGILKGLIGLQPQKYDASMIDEMGKAFKKADQKPDCVMAYFMGLDAFSHANGPETQQKYLEKEVDPLLGKLLDLLNTHGMLDDAMFVIVSDHGQIETPGDDEHTIRLGFPADRELDDFFKDLNLDVHDMPGEDPNVDAVVALNGGMAHVYLRHGQGEWPAFPRYQEDVVRVAQAFVEANESGKYCGDLKNTLDAVLIRNVEAAQNWDAPYSVYQNGGKLVSIEDWLHRNMASGYVDAANRIRLATSERTGDLILLAKATQGVYFGGPGLEGVHGSLAADDSRAVLSVCVPDASEADQQAMRERAEQLVMDRCDAEGDRKPSVADAGYLIRKLWLGV
jgi:hypothetical protein